MTQDRKRKRRVRALAAETGQRYTRAARQLTAARPATGVGTPPTDWPAWAGQHPATVAVYRDRDGNDDLLVLDSATDAPLAELSVPHVPSAALLAEYEVDGLLGVPDSPGRHEREIEVGLGRPDLAAHRMGYQVRGVGEWHPWTDGSWRSPAAPATTRHTATVTPTGESGLHLVVRAQPGDRVVADVVAGTAAWDRLDATVDRLGYTAVGGRWQRLPGGVRWAPVRPGHLAERDWWTLARVRVTRRTIASTTDPYDTVTYGVGEVVTLNQRGRAGREIDRSRWSSSTGDDAYVLPADAVETVEVLAEHPPTWAAAALSAERVTGLLAGYHPGAAEAAAAWDAAGLHVAHGHDGLVVRTPAPEYRRVGQVRREYWFGDVHSGPYEAIRDGNAQRLDALPLDPVGVADGLATDA